MRIARELYEEIVAHAQAEAPNECCGMIGARDDEVVTVYPTANAAASPLRFEIDPEEQIRVHHEIEAANLDLGAIYHSHTRTEPKPSQTDINFAAWWPEVLWIIIGLANGATDVRSWRIEDGTAVEAELVVD